MAIQTFQETEIFIEGLPDYGFHRMQHITRAVLSNILERFFNKNLKSYQLCLNTIDDYANDNLSGKQKLWILKEFPYGQRKVPSIVIELGDIRENKRYIGTDNEIAVVETPSGKRAETQYYGSANIPVAFLIQAESHDVRQEVSDLIYSCFTHYHRWQYFFKGDDDSVFSITLSQDPVVLGTNKQISDSSGSQKVLYIKIVNITVSVDFIYFDNLKASKYTLIGNYAFDPKNGTLST